MTTKERRKKMNKIVDVKKTTRYKGNAGLWFYREFYKKYYDHEESVTNEKEEDYRKWFNATCNELLEAKWSDFVDTAQKYKELPFYNNENGFNLTTVYPGLVCGLGYEHAANIKNEFQLGFSFDHTTGMPYVPGSSVKGLLRSAFRHPEYIKNIVKGLTEANPDAEKIAEATDWKKLELSIFEGIKYTTKKDLGSIETDLFFDAFISGNTNSNDFFMADDYITPHQNWKKPEMSPFKNPLPVRFLKVRSGVTFTFGFRLTDTVIFDDLLFSKELKRELFKKILLDLGIGAKTNVGYGQFE
jgi:CRISPR-associated protein Cmr6